MLGNQDLSLDQPSKPRYLSDAGIEVFCWQWHMLSSLSSSQPEFYLVCRTLESAEKSCLQESRTRILIPLEVTDDRALDAAVAKHNLVISLIPYTSHIAVIKSAVGNKNNVDSPTITGIGKRQRRQESPS